MGNFQPVRRCRITSLRDAACFKDCAVSLLKRDGTGLRFVKGIERAVSRYVVRSPFCIVYGIVVLGKTINIILLLLCERIAHHAPAVLLGHINVGDGFIVIKIQPVSVQRQSRIGRVEREQPIRLTDPASLGIVIIHPAFELLFVRNIIVLSIWCAAVIHERRAHCFPKCIVIRGAVCLKVHNSAALGHIPVVMAAVLIIAFLKFFVRLEHIRVAHLSGFVPCRVVPCRVNLVQSAVNLHEIPRVVHLVTCHNIAVDAKFIQQVFIGECIALTNCNLVYQHAVSAIRHRWDCLVCQTLFVVFTVQHNIVMECDCCL